MDFCAAEELGYTQRLKEPFNQSQEYKKMLQPQKVPCRPNHLSEFLGQAPFDKNAKVRIFWSPNFKKTTIISN